MSDPLPPEPPNYEPPNFEPPASAPAEPPPWATPGGTAPMDAEPKPKGSAWKSWVAAGVVTAAFAGGAVIAISVAGGSKDSPTTQAAAATDQGSDQSGGDTNGPSFAAQRGARGTITAIDGTTLILDSNNQSGETSTVTVETTDDTAFRETVDGTLGDIAVGDNVIAMGTPSDSGLTAANIIDTGDDAAGAGFHAGGPPPDGADGTPPSFPDGGPAGGGNAPGGGEFRGGAGGFAAGTVKSIDGTTITVESADGSTVTVSTTADTTISVTKTITLGDLEVGDTVTAMGETDGSTVTADTVQKGDFGIGGGRFRGPDGAPPQTSTD